MVGCLWLRLLIVKYLVAYVVSGDDGTAASPISFVFVVRLFSPELWGTLGCRVFHQLSPASAKAGAKRRGLLWRPVGEGSRVTTIRPKGSMITYFVEIHIMQV